MSDRRILRVIDANLNRSREGLRVCEEIARFILKDKSLREQLKKARHEINGCVPALPVSVGQLFACRNVWGDFGKKPHRLERRRTGISDLFLANAQRTKESLRTLEEASKILGGRAHEKFKKIRFKVYAIEKKALPKLETICDHGP